MYNITKYFVDLISEIEKHQDEQNEYLTFIKTLSPLINFDNKHFNIDNFIINMSNVNEDVIYKYCNYLYNYILYTGLQKDIFDIINDINVYDTIKQNYIQSDLEIFNKKYNAVYLKPLMLNDFEDNLVLSIINNSQVNIDININNFDEDLIRKILIPKDFKKAYNLTDINTIKLNFITYFKLWNDYFNLLTVLKEKFNGDLIILNPPKYHPILKNYIINKFKLLKIKEIKDNDYASEILLKTSSEKTGFNTFKNKYLSDDFLKPIDLSFLDDFFDNLKPLSNDDLILYINEIENKTNHVY